MRKGDYVTYDGQDYYRLNINGYNALYKIIDGRIAYEKGYVLEHRFLYELYHGVKLKKTEYVHHKNHDRSDNSVENLVMLSASEHAQLHALEDGKNVIDKSDVSSYSTGTKGVVRVKRTCPDCGKPVKGGAVRCMSCFRKSRQHPAMPSKDVLAEYIQTMNNVEIGKLCGVSDRAVAKWRKKYGLPSSDEQHGWNRGPKSGVRSRDIQELLDIAQTTLAIE